jgi:hypothetical protein
MARKVGSPAQERGICPQCGGKTLGNTYVARPARETAFAYRQCHNRGCDHIARLDGVTPEPPTARKSDFPANKRERAVYEHYLSGSERGDLYRYVKMGKAGLPGPERSFTNAYAAWMAGKALVQ